LVILLSAQTGLVDTAEHTDWSYILSVAAFSQLKMLLSELAVIFRPVDLKINISAISRLTKARRYPIYNVDNLLIFGNL